MIPCLHPTLLAGLLAASIVALSGPTTRADVLFSTFGPGNSYAASGGSLVSGSSSPSTAFSEANEFTAAFTGQLSGLSVAVALGASVPASNGSFDLQIVSNNPATNLPLFASALTVGTLQTASTTPAVLSLTSPTAYPFVAGNAYWLILAPHTSTTDLTWKAATNPDATTGAYMSATTGGQFAASSNGANAFEISATAPEPATWALLLLGTGLVWVLGRQAASRRQPAI